MKNVGVCVSLVGALLLSFHASAARLSQNPPAAAPAAPAPAKMPFDAMMGPLKTDKDANGPVHDFREQRPTNAITSFIEIMKTWYPFTEYKKLDWCAISSRVLPLAHKAEAEDDAALWWEALIELQASIPDGHVSLLAESDAPLQRISAVRVEKMGGSFGFAVLPDETGSAIVVDVVPGSDAEGKGVKVGQKVTIRDGTPMSILVAPEKRLFKWATAFGGSENPTTTANKIWHSHRFVTRAPVGTSAKWTVVGLGELTLTAQDDQIRGVLATASRSPLEKDQAVTHRKLPSGVGYIAIGSEPEGDAAEAWKSSIIAAMKDFDKVPGLIVDLRHNLGGSDELGAWFSGAFFANNTEPAGYDTINGKALYEQTKFPNLWLGSGKAKQNGLNKFLSEKAASNGSTVMTLPTGETTLGVGPFYVEPQGLWRKPLVCIVNAESIGTGEGLARGCSRAGAELVGFTGTSGSFGVTGGQIWLPGNIAFTHPFGTSIDANGKVQIETDASGKGGNLPTQAVPRTAENLIAFALGNIDKSLGDASDPELATAERVAKWKIGQGVGDPRKLQKLLPYQPDGQPQEVFKTRCINLLNNAFEKAGYQSDLVLQLFPKCRWEKPECDELAADLKERLASPAIGATHPMGLVEPANGMANVYGWCDKVYQMTKSKAASEMDRVHIGWH